MVKPDLGDAWKDYALFNVAKNRQGRTGDVHLFYVGEQTRFGAWAGSPPSNQSVNEPRKGREL
jgi:replicative DNA helicase